MRRFALGYPIDPDGCEPFAELVADYADHVAEAFFSMPGEPSGRLDVDGDDASRAATTERLLHDLRAVRGMGVKLDLLFNANCYGEHAISRTLEDHVIDTLEHLAEAVGHIDVVTTASPAVAHVIKAHARDLPGGDIEVRASVNMRIGTTQAMAYVADLFDSYYIQRDHQRDLDHVERIRQWADANGKALGMLANSGCLHCCPTQSFHDNLVAHAADACRHTRIEGFQPLACRRVLSQPDRRAALMQATWIRPEDLHHYEPYVDVIKLATRAHRQPRLVLDAYARRRFHGNLLELLEPGYAPLFAPSLIDNDRFPDDWFAQTSTCDRDCEACGYCEAALQRAILTCDEEPAQGTAFLERSPPTSFA